MVKIFRKVAVEFSREVEIIGGGGGVETFWGADGIISVVQSFFMGIAIFPVGLFSVAGSVF